MSCLSTDTSAPSPARTPRVHRLLFANTAAAIAARQQTVTRLCDPDVETRGLIEVGDIIEAFAEAWMLTCPAPITPMARLTVVKVSRETLGCMLSNPTYATTELRKEGVPLAVTPQRHVLGMIARHPRLTLDSVVTRVEFVYDVAGPAFRGAGGDVDLLSSPHLGA